MVRKISDKVKENKYCLVSFAIASLCMYMILLYAGVTKSGVYTLLNGDLSSIYLPAIRNLCRDIINGESIYYSWNTCLGMNTSLYNAFYAFSPLNILYLIFYKSDLDTLTVVIIILKTGLAAMCFQLFVDKAHKVDGMWSVILSVCYATCYFQLAYNTINIIWLDAMYMLPAVFLFIHYLLKRGEFWGLILCYAYIFISHFYMGYMIGVISLCYFVLCLVEKKINHDIDDLKKNIFKYISAVVISIGISAFVWLPTVYFILHNHTEDSIRKVFYNINFLDVFMQAFWGHINRSGGDYPNIYCGIIPLLLMFVFFANKNIKKFEKIKYGSLLGIMVTSCTANVMYMFWHGFDIPDGWPYRFSFIISFLICLCGTIATKDIEKVSMMTLMVIAFIVMAAFVLGMSLFGDKYDVIISDKKNNIIINSVLIILWSFILILYIHLKESERRKLLILICVLVVTENLSNHGMLFTSGKASYRLWYSSMKEAETYFNMDEDFYRVDSFYDLSVNSGTMFGFNGIGHFASAENEAVCNVLGKLGMYRSPRITLNYGMTPVTEMLLGVKYKLFGVFEDYVNEDRTDVRIEKNQESLSLGYMISGNCNDYILENSDPFKNNNNILSVMTGKELFPFREIDLNRIYAQENGINIKYNGEGYDVFVDDANDPEASLIFHVTDEGKKCYGYFYNRYSSRENACDYFVLDGGVENAISKDGDLHVSYIKEMSNIDNEYILSISRVGNITKSGFDDLFFYEFDPDELSKAYEILKKEELDIIEYNDGYIKGNVSVNDNKRILFLSIPYDRGWSAKVNGKQADIIPTVNDAFTSIELPGIGEYEIELLYKAEGSRAGVSISIVCVMILVCVIVASNKYKERK